MGRTILHVDLDAFYASVEIRDDASLVGKPVIVGGHDRRGVVTAASYEARKYGVHSAMSMVEAHSRCPQAVVIRPRMGHYAEVSAEFFEILHRWSPLVEGLSLDEAFVDVTGEERLFGDGRTIGKAIKEAVRGELRLVASVGVAPVKLVAKIASDVGKPDGLVVVGDGGGDGDGDGGGEVEAFLRPLPIGRLWGVGEVTGRSLGEIGVRTFGDLLGVGEAVLAARIGKDGAARMLRLARGEDPRAVEPSRTAVSIGAEETFEGDLRDRGELGERLLAQVDRACARARAAGERARTITVKVKYADHELVTRRTTLGRATADGRVVGKEAVKLLGVVPGIERRGVRLTGISLSGLERKDAPRQLGFDEKEAEKGEKLGETIDRIAERFGSGAVRRAVHVGDEDEGGEGD